MRDFFTTFARKTAMIVGAYWAFLGAVLLVVGWAATGPIFHYSDTWQLVINTATTIITFLMVFLIQNTQNRDGRAMQLKLNELIAAVKEAHNDMIDIESLSDAQLERIARRFENPNRIGMPDEVRVEKLEYAESGEGDRVRARSTSAARPETAGR
jgi:low affinity Fe/Cu permease